MDENQKDEIQTEKHKTKYLKNYRPPAYLIDKIDLRFDLEEKYTTVTSTMKIRRNREVADENTPLVFDCKELELISVVANDMVLCSEEYELDKTTFKLPKVPEEFLLEIKNRVRPHENTALEGLYKSGGTGGYKRGGTFCTQCEAEGFRRITCFPDRPDVMTHFSCIITADKASYPVLLSNGNLLEKGDMPDGRHYAKWDDPFRKPCYLFALVAGDLALIEDSFTTCSGREIKLHIYVEHENRNMCDYAMKALKNSMKWDEERFGREYDLDLFQIVAVNDFNMGAMENKGLNIFNSRYVLADTKTATDTDFMNIERVVGHEYFHNWTGNRITLRNWFQLSLKEGLTVFRDQEFSSDLNSRAVQRIADVRKLRTLQFAEDSGPMTHPVRPESYIEMNNFYTMTVYEKGSEVIRMIFTILGKETFRKGMDLYFERFDGQAVTTEDFVRTMEDASGVDLSQFRLWYSQSGTPHVSVTREYDENEKKLMLHFTQKTEPDRNQSVKLPLHIPVRIGLISPSGTEISLNEESIRDNGGSLPADISASEKASSSKNEIMLNLAKESETFSFNDIPKGTLPSLFRSFSAPVIIRTDLTSEELAFLMANDTDEFNRWDAAQQLYFIEIDSIIKSIKSGDLPAVSYHLLSAFKKALSDSIGEMPTTAGVVDRAFSAKALTLPDETEIAQKYYPIDVDSIHAARSFLERKLAKECEKDLRKVIDICSKADPSDLSPESMADRSLKNCALSYIGALDTDEAHQIILGHYNNARNMTDEIASLAILCGEGGSESDDLEKALEKFREKWKAYPLVMDKWFAVQSASTRADTLQRIKRLVEYPEFSWKNPNRVRSVMAVLGTTNPVIFHQRNGDGYKFFAEKVIELDKINSQIAARMVSAFNRWKKYDEKRRDMMKKELEKMVALPNLSRDVYEIVSRALE